MSFNLHANYFSKMLSRLLKLIQEMFLSFFRFFRALLRGCYWPQIIGTALSVLGTLIWFSPNSSEAINFYQSKCPYFHRLREGVNYLTSFDLELSEQDYRQRDKSLKRGEPGFNEVLGALILIRPEKIKDKDRVLEITGRRESSYREGTGEFFDLLKLIHVNIPGDGVPYKLITSEFELRKTCDDIRNRLIESIGVAFVVFGLLVPHLWRGFIFVLDVIRKKQEL